MCLPSSVCVGLRAQVCNSFLFFSLTLLLPVPLSAVRKMTIYEERSTTMRVQWEAAVGATGYMLLYSAINATEASVEKEVRPLLSTLRERNAGLASWGVDEFKYTHAQKHKHWRPPPHTHTKPIFK